MTRNGWQAWLRGGLVLAMAGLAGCPSAAEKPRAVADDPLQKVGGQPATAPAPTFTAVPDGSPVIASLPDGIEITRGQLDQVLYQSYGITLLGDLAELRLAEVQLSQARMTLSDADVQAEKQRFFDKTFEGVPPAERDQYFRQLKAQRHLTDVEFALGFRKTAALRKLAHRNVAGKVSDAEIRRAFGMLYGENRQIADIAVSNMVQYGAVRGDLAAGMDFEAVARKYSKDLRTKERGGVWPPFSSQTPTVPQVIMEAAFALQPGEVTKEPITDGTQYHVIKLLRVIPPKLVKYDDVKADVRKQVEDQVEQSQIEQYQQLLRQQAVLGLKIDDPTLAKSLQDYIDAQRPKGTVNPDEVGRRAHSQPAGPPAPATAPVAAGR